MNNEIKGKKDAISRASRYCPQGAPQFRFTGLEKAPNLLKGELRVASSSLQTQAF